MSNRLAASEVKVSPKSYPRLDHEKAKKFFYFLDISSATKKDYQARISHFLDFITEEGMDRNSFLEYKNYLKSRTDYTVSTKNKYLVTAKVFLKELNRRGILPADITQNIKSFSQSKKHKKEGLNDEEIETLTRTLKDLPNTAENTRIKAIVSLLIFQGLRQVEIARLDVKDIDLIRKTALIKGKGQDDKEIIYLHPETVKHIKATTLRRIISKTALFLSVRAIIIRIRIRGLPPED